jgi:hypothetical protein
VDAGFAGVREDVAGSRSAAPARASLPSGRGVGGGVFGDRGGGVFGGTGAPLSVSYVQRQAPSGIPSRQVTQPPQPPQSPQNNNFQVLSLLVFQVQKYKY